MLTKMNGNKNCSSFECDLDYSAEILYQYWIDLYGGYTQEIQGYIWTWFVIPFLTPLILCACSLFIGKKHADISIFLPLNSSEYSHNKKSNMCTHE